MRTPKDYVKQMFQEGKKPDHIRAVAQNSRWKSQISEIDKWIEYGQNRKKSKKLKIKRKSG